MRKWQFGKQVAFGTAATATRRVPFRGTLDYNPNWTEQDEVDVGSIDPVLPPYRVGADITATLTAPLSYQDIPLLMSAGLRGGVSGVADGTAYTWTHTGLSTTATTLDYFTAEWCDDVTTDGFKAKDGIVETLEFSFDDTLGPWRVSSSWRFGSADHGVTPTTALNVSSNLPLVFGADTALYIDDTSGGIGGTIISDALHAATITIENTIDLKRFANGSNTRFAITGYGIAGRMVRASFTFAKTDAIVAALNSEVHDWLSANPVNRYLKLLAQSTQLAKVAVPYSWDLRLAGTWRSRSDGERGGNSSVTLELVGMYASDLGYPVQSIAVNTLAALP
jgi:hypothetical protein